MDKLIANIWKGEGPSNILNRREEFGMAKDRRAKDKVSMITGPHTSWGSMKGLQF